ncbi:MAG: ChbG/HpnK family deacetylase [Hyphomicrobiaceae bacterium]
MRDPLSGGVILCADDYGLSGGVSRGILELLEGRHINATSAMVTFPRWVGDAPALAGVRSHSALGLHLNLTVGAPLGVMRRLAPDGALPTIGQATRLALSGKIDTGEIEAETLRQLAAFETATGFKPDHVDGHQHVHALPGFRRGVLAAMAAFYGELRPLVRDPADRWSTIIRRGGDTKKALGLAMLASGFAAAARRHRFFTNRGFSGYSTFDTKKPYAEEIAVALRYTEGGCIVMCHPGYPDAELAGRDPVLARRAQELEALRGNAGVETHLTAIAREGDAAILDWGRLGAHGG